jgi:thiol:disulfide interchange protein DsbA
MKSGNGIFPGESHALRIMGRSLIVVALLLGLTACGEKPAPQGSPAAAATAAEVASAPPVAVSQSGTVPTAAAAPESRPASAPLQPGVHYAPLASPQPTESGKKVEVLEFFWYACPHCYHLQPSLETWLKRKPADVDFRRVPAVLDTSWQQLARTYYAIEAMGLIDKLHRELFDAIHQKRVLDPRALARDPKPLFDWVAAKGVDRQKFMDTYNSFAVSNRTQRASDLTRNYDVPHTPVLVVDGATSFHHR